MSINTMEYAAVFMQELDSQMVECATSGWMEDNAGQVPVSYTHLMQKGWQ